MAEVLLNHGARCYATIVYQMKNLVSLMHKNTLKIDLYKILISCLAVHSIRLIVALT